MRTIAVVLAYTTISCVVPLNVGGVAVGGTGNKMDIKQDIHQNIDQNVGTSTTQVDKTSGARFGLGSSKQAVLRALGQPQSVCTRCTGLGGEEDAWHYGPDVCVYNSCMIIISRDGKVSHHDGVKPAYLLF